MIKYFILLLAILTVWTNAGTTLVAAKEKQPTMEHSFSGTTKLHTMSRHGEIEKIKLLINNKAIVNAQDIDGKTPLHLALDLETANLLLDAGANSDILDYRGNSILHYAAFRDALDLLKSWAIDPPLRDHKNVAGRTALFSAIIGNNPKALELLIISGASFTESDYSGLYPLHYATKENSPLLVRLLLKAGADINCTDKDGSTPLHYAAFFHKNEVLSILVQHGANTQLKMTAQDNIQLRPLEAAVASGNEVAIELLNN